VVGGSVDDIPALAPSLGAVSWIRASAGFGGSAWLLVHIEQNFYVREGLATFFKTAGERLFRDRTTGNVAQQQLLESVEQGIVSAMPRLDC